MSRSLLLQAKPILQDIGDLLTSLSAQDMDKISYNLHFPVLTFISLCAFGFALYQTFALSNYFLLTIGLMCLMALFDNQELSSIALIKKGSLLAGFVFLLTYFVSNFPIVALNLLLITPLMVFFISGNMQTAFLAFSFQLFINKFFLEARCIETLMRADSQELYDNFFSSFHFNAFLALLFHFFLLRKANQVIVPATAILQDTFLLPQLNEHKNTITQLKETLRLNQNLLRSHEDTLITIAHECKNPLNGVQSNLELAEAILHDPLSRQTVNLDKIERFVYNARICGEFLLQHLNNILDAGKIESGTIDINPASTDIKSLLEKVWAICSESIKRKNLSGSLKLKVDVPPYLFIDAHRLTQIMINLINNSIKFTAKGDISVHIEWKSLDSQITGEGRNKARFLSVIPTFPSICIDELTANCPDQQFEHSKTLNTSLAKGLYTKESYTLNLNQTSFDNTLLSLRKINSSKKGFLVIEVRDSGCGISKENLSKLFVKFSQVSADPSQRKMGTGLGLWLCQKLCQKMQGIIEADSKLGFGSSFRVKIPTEICESPLRKSFKKLPHVPTTVSERFDDAMANKKVNALVVDDLAYNREVHKLLLKKCNCEILCEASTGKKAIEEYKNHAGKIDLVVIDLEMPEMGGLEACRLIRLYERAHNLKSSYIVVISSNNEDNVAKQHFEEKTPLFDLYVKKPCPLSEFQNIVEEALMKSIAKVSCSFSPKQGFCVSKKKVLIVDDDGFCLEAAKNFFESANIESVTALSGIEGVKTLKMQYSEIGCVLIDFEMPCMNGKQTFLEMKTFLASIKRKDIPIFCTSGNTCTGFVNEMKEIGFNEVHSKPLNWKKLMAAVKCAINTV